MSDSNEFIKLEEYFKLQVWEEQNEFGIRLGHPVLEHEIGKIPPLYETNTRYNKRKAFDFKYEGLNVEDNEINFKCKFNVRNSQRYPIGGGTYETFNQTYTVTSAIKLDVANRDFTYHARIKQVQSGFPQGALGWLMGMFDLEYRFLTFIVSQQDPGNFTDTIITITSGLFTSSAPVEHLQSQNKCINKFINEGIIYPSSIRMDDKGVWFIFKYEQPNLQKIINIIQSGAC